MHLVGLTGGIATGKSTVSDILIQQSNALNISMARVDADVIARQVVDPGQPAYNKIVDYFGQDILDQSHSPPTIDRAALGARIFTNEQDRKRLNSFTHPYIRREMLRQILYAFLSLTSVVIVDVPLLIESRLHRFVHTVMVVNCSADIQKSRLMKRNQYSESEAEQRIQSQMPMADKLASADVVINNSEDVTSTEQQVVFVLKNRLKPRMWTTWIAWTALNLPAAISYAALTVWKWLKL